MFQMLTCRSSFRIVCCARHASERRQTGATSSQHHQPAMKILYCSSGNIIQNKIKAYKQKFTTNNTWHCLH